VNGNNAGSQQQGQPNLRHVMGVGWQPTAVKGNNAGSQQQGQGTLACGVVKSRLAKLIETRPWLDKMG